MPDLSSAGGGPFDLSVGGRPARRPRADIRIARPACLALEDVLACTKPAEPAYRMSGTSILVERLYTG